MRSILAAAGLSLLAGVATVAAIGGGPVRQPNPGLVQAQQAAQAVQQNVAAAAVGQAQQQSSASGPMPIRTGGYSTGRPLLYGSTGNAAPIFRGASIDMADDYYRRTGRNIFQDAPATVYETFP